MPLKKHFDKKVVMTKEDDEIFENSIKYLICDVYVEGDVKVRDHCYIFWKYRGSPHRNPNINVLVNQQIHVVFHNLKKLFLSHYARTRQIQS